MVTEFFDTKFADLYSDIFPDISADVFAEVASKFAVQFLPRFLWDGKSLDLSSFRENRATDAETCRIVSSLTRRAIEAPMCARRYGFHTSESKLAGLLSSIPTLRAGRGEQYPQHHEQLIRRS